MKLPTWLKPVLEGIAGIALIAGGSTHWADGLGVYAIGAGTTLFGAAVTGIISPTDQAAIVQAVEDAVAKLDPPATPPSSG